MQNFRQFKFQNSYTMSSSSMTTVSQNVGEHRWTIQNWRGWLNCSERQGADLFSSPFFVVLAHGQGHDQGQWERQEVAFMIKAFPKKNREMGHDMLAFRLVCLASKPPKGTFKFKTVATGILGGQTTVSSFSALPIDAAHHWVTCVRYHPEKDLTIRVKVNVVSTDKALPLIPSLSNGVQNGANGKKAIWKKVVKKLVKLMLANDEDTRPLLPAGGIRFDPL